MSAPPVDVVEYDDERLAAGEGFDKRANGPKRLFRTTQPVREPNHLAEPLCDERGIIGAFQKRRQSREVLVGRGSVVEPRSVANCLPNWPVRDSLSVRKTSSASDERVVRDISDELADEARLPDAGRSDDREQLAGPVAERLLERVVEAPLLTLSSDHGRVEAATGVELEWTHSDEPPVISSRLDLGGNSDERQRPLVDKQLAG